MTQSGSLKIKYRPYYFCDDCFHSFHSQEVQCDLLGSSRAAGNADGVAMVDMVGTVALLINNYQSSL